MLVDINIPKSIIDFNACKLGMEKPKSQYPNTSFVACMEHLCHAVKASPKWVIKTSKIQAWSKKIATLRCHKHRVLP